MNPFEFINNHVFSIAITIVVLFILFLIWKVIKLNNMPNPIKKNFRDKVKDLYENLQNSNYVKGLEEEKKTASFDDMMPKELFTEENEDQFTTDLSKLDKTKL